MRIILLIFCFTIINCNLLYTQFVQKSHYNTKNVFLNFLKIDEDRINLYGHDGAVLRSTDAGENWHQNFSGTHSFILNQKSYKNKIYGINSENKLMISDDYGDFWKYVNLNFDCKDLEIYNDTLYIISDNSIFYKSIKDENFIENKLQISDLNKIKALGEHLILFDTDNNVYHSDLSMFDFKKLNTKMNTNSKYFISEEKFTYYFGKTFGVINKNLEEDFYDNIQIPNIIHYTKIVDNEAYLISTSNQNEIVIYSYNLKTKEISDSLANFVIPDLASRVSNYKQLILDIENMGDKLLISISGKIVISFDIKNSKFSELIYSPRDYFTTEGLIIDNDNILLRGTNTLYRSSDGGKIFKSTNNYFVDSVSQIIPINLMFFDYYTTSNKTLFLSLEEIFYTSNISKLYYTNDKGITFDSLDGFNFGEIKFLKEEDGYLYLCYKKEVFPLGSKTLEFVKMNIDNKEYEIINSIKFIDGILESISVNEIDYFMFTKYTDWDSKTKKSYLVKSSDNFESFDTINHFDNLGTYIFKYDKNNIIIRNEFIYDIKNEALITLKDSTLKSIARIPIRNYNSLENIKLIQYEAKMIDMFSADYKNKFVKIKLENDRFEVDTLGDAESGVNILPTIYYGNNNDFNIISVPASNFYIPIEPERLDFYATSVEIPPSIWTYAPYPNPVKDKFRIKFYSAMMNQIQDLKLELIHITSGRSYQIKNYNIIVNDSYWGEVDIDVTGIIPGPYLINFEIGGSNKSEAIIIE